MAQWVKVPVIKTADSSSVFGTHVVERFDFWKLSFNIYVLSVAYKCSDWCVSTHTQAYTHTLKTFKIVLTLDTDLIIWSIICHGRNYFFMCTWKSFLTVLKAGRYLVSLKFSFDLTVTVKLKSLLSYNIHRALIRSCVIHKLFKAKRFITFIMFGTISSLI